MKSNYKKIIGLASIVIFHFNGINAQTEIIFNPSLLEPDQTGYYVSGVEVDENKDGTMEFHNKCDDYYEVPTSPQDNHHETGTQQDFSYINCMIMPTCEHKGTAIEPPVATGYIQMAPCLYMGTDSASISAITTPPLQNIDSMLMETSSDVSINETRKIPYNIEYSKDNGITWEETFIKDNVATQGGYRITYSSEQSLEFDEMITASKAAPIIIRISTNDASIERPNKGQYVKVHLIKIYAEKSSASKEINLNNKYTYRVQEFTVLSEQNCAFSLYNNVGQLIGKGKIVEVPLPGLYIAVASDGTVKKLIIK